MRRNGFGVFAKGLATYQAALVTADNAYVDAVQSAATTAAFRQPPRARSIWRASQRRLRRSSHENRIRPIPDGDTGKRAIRLRLRLALLRAGVAAAGHCCRRR